LTKFLSTADDFWGLAVGADGNRPVYVMDFLSSWRLGALRGGRERPSAPSLLSLPRAAVALPFRASAIIPFFASSFNKSNSLGIKLTAPAAAFLIKMWMGSGTDNINQRQNEKYKNQHQKSPQSSSPNIILI
jgi:hypothetical protein